MTIARSLIINPDEPGWYHCISRCVRRAFLCGKDHRGNDFEHRRAWIRDRLKFLAGLYAVEVASYAIMANHFHIVVRVNPQEPAQWDDYEVTRRWLTIFPSAYTVDGSPIAPAPDLIHKRSEDPAFVQKARSRLGNLSWFMRSFKEPIARRANKEDDCKGAFWEGRFTSIALLDEAAVLSCMAYVDLNPIRAAVAQTPEKSDYTSVQERVALYATNAIGDQSRLLQKGSPEVATYASWLLPISACGRGIDERWYLDLIDGTGRHLCGGKTGAIPSTLPPILHRLSLDPVRWVEAMGREGESRGTALGHAASRIVEAARRGCQWISSYSRLFAGQPLKV